jgi:hypothetical protein
MLDQEEKEDTQWIERRAQEFCGHAEGPKTGGDPEL